MPGLRVAVRSAETSWAGKAIGVALGQQLDQLAVRLEQFAASGPVF
jgi:hypothetical protein